MGSRAIILVGLLASAGAAWATEDRNTKVLNDRREIEATGLWIYNDLPRAIALAERLSKPLLVVFR